MTGNAWSGGRRTGTRVVTVIAVAVAGITGFAVHSAADPGGVKTYRVTIENLAPDRGGGASQVLSPPLVVVHSNRFDLFTVGAPANPAVSDLAEDAIGATGISMFAGDPAVGHVGQPGGPILPGRSAGFEVETRGKTNLLSLVTMLVNTNDAFTGLDAVRLSGPRKEFHVFAYDAGSEVNDQLIASIPGPCCGDTGRNGMDEFGVISPHSGILDGVGDLDPSLWGWPTGQPVARIRVERIR